MSRRLRFLATVVASLALAGGYKPITPIDSGTPVFAAGELTDLKGIEELKALFNRDAGKTRLVLLLSPT